MSPLSSFFRIRDAKASTFPWEYDTQETCLIIEGRALVKTAEGDVEFGEGDYIIFPRGLKCTWKIKKRIRKYYKFD